MEDPDADLKAAAAALETRLLSKAKEAHDLQVKLEQARAVSNKAELEVTRLKDALRREQLQVQQLQQDAMVRDLDKIERERSLVNDIKHKAKPGDKEANLEARLSKARQENKQLQNQVKQLHATVRKLQEDNREKLRQKALGTDDSSLAMEQVKARNLELFQRLSAQKAGTKAASTECKKRDLQICALTEHIEKLMNALKLEREGKRQAEQDKARAEQQVQLKMMEIQKFKVSNRNIKKHAETVDKQDLLLTQQLELLDTKYQNLYKSHQTVKALASRKEKTYATQIEQISNWVWENDTKVSNALTAKTNTLLGAIKLYESVFGHMRCAVMDFQECMMGDAGAKALSRAIEATVARQNQFQDSLTMQHASRFNTWRRTDDMNGPMPVFGGTGAGASGGNQLPKRCLLNLSYNGITDDGVKTLMVALAKSKYITEVDLRGNRITKRSLPFLADALMYNENIQAMDLSGNQISKGELGEYMEKRLAKAHRKSVDNDNASCDDSESGDEDSALTSDDEEWDRDADELGDEVDHDTQFFKNLPVLSSKDKIGNSFFRYESVPRPKSAPPRTRTVSRERIPGAFLPKHAHHSDLPGSKLQSLAASDVLKQIDRARLYPPQKTPFSAISRITLDSISTKMALKNARRVRPRPESALISRDGGQEMLKMADSVQRQAMGGRRASNMSGLNKTAAGKVKFTSSKIRDRLSIATTTQIVRPQTAPHRNTIIGGTLPGANTGKVPGPMLTTSPSRKTLITTSSSGSSSMASNGMGPGGLARGSTNAREIESANAHVEFAPVGMQKVFAFARKGNIAGILNCMKKIEPSALLAKTGESFLPNMRPP
ncbi:Ankyrin repeat domain-containing protein 1 [Durusdinium trenchii]|uniref:Ankyrin repeat domain-containing protein 1 n=1 Tax=Durusdinium trenchii TaxID=1381693 RepID=A0ABP0HHZ9_9DINO